MFHLYHSAAQDLAAIRGGSYCLWRNKRSEGKDSNKDNPSSVKYCSPWQFQVGRTQRKCYWCTAAAWEANNQHTTHLQGDRTQNKGSNTRAVGNSSAWTHLHVSGERTIVQEHHLGKKENSTDPTVGRSDGISFAEADGALRSFLATCFPSSERNQ